ncbi:MAG: hypothetical protein KME03_04860 [Aphanocapsa lilacina HA4352-LM1]|jgi:hypothetical protein|nr:hypothetical protein [Aphanocapsa lilacina HA4352-LM1]
MTTKVCIDFTNRFGASWAQELADAALHKHPIVAIYFFAISSPNLLGTLQGTQLGLRLLKSAPD